MAAERDLELIDDYLANRLNATEKAAFEQKLVSTPDLQAELTLQQEVISGIQKARMAELKAMMNNIPVPAVQTGGGMLSKFAILATVVGVVGVGSYLLVKDSDTTQTPSETAAPKELPKSDNPETTNTVKPTPQSGDDTKSRDNSPVVSEEEASSEQKPVGAPKPLKKTNPTTPVGPDLKVFDPTEEEASGASAKPFEGAVAPTLKEHSELAVDIDSMNKKYSFHYQFKNGKLMLYGPFSAGLYEVLEFFSDDTKTVFLYYNNNYYLLRDNNQKVKPLVTVQNADLIRKLNDYRK